MNQSIKKIIVGLFGDEILEKLVQVENVGLMDRDVVYKIYKRRSLISDKVTPDLIKSLKESKEKKVLLKNVTVDGEEYLLFLDQRETTLIGVVKIST